MKPQEFDILAEQWRDDGDPDFNVIGMSRHTVIDGEFFIRRITVI